jgi:tRNA(Ile)-lysidine synthase
LILRFRKHIDQNFPFLAGKRILVACSGGIDSVVLAYLLKDLGEDMGLAHCNFGLRGKESDDDQLFVVELSERWNIPVFAESFETKKYAEIHKVSTQMAARNLRYQWFEEIRSDFQYDFVATAHHADDDLETFFINFSRGTGLRGLTGIPEHNDFIVRPLLAFSREDIFRFAKENKIAWREDSSNIGKDYLRNQIRHDVIPPFKNISDAWLSTFRKTQNNLRNSEALVQDYLQLVTHLVMEEGPLGLSLHISKLNELPNRQALLYELLAPYGFTAWVDIDHLLAGQSGKQIFSKSFRLIKDREVLLLTQIPSEEIKDEKNITKSESQIDEPLKMSFIPTDKMGYIDNRTIYVDNDKLMYPLTLRKWQEGDVFQPFGMKGKKKLSKFFKDEKLSLAAKREVWVLLSKNQIVWIVGHRMDDRFKITPNTNKILKISVA